MPNAMGELSDEEIFGAAPAQQAVAGELSDEDVFGAPEMPGLGQRFVTNAKEALASNPLPAVERYLSQKGGAFLAPLLGEDNFLERHAAELMQRRREIGAEYEAMPSYTEEPSLPGRLAAGAASLAGQLAGSAADPSSLVAPGSSAVGRIAGNAAVNAGTDLVGQLADVGTGLRDSYSPAQTAISAAGGAGFQAVSEIITKIAARLGRAPETVTPEDVADAAHSDPEIDAALRDAGYGNTAIEGIDPDLAKRYVERRQARQAEDALRSNSAQPDAPEGHRRRDMKNQEAEIDRQRATAEGIQSGEIDPGADPRMGQQPRQSDKPIVVDSMGRASKPGDAGARAGMQANGGVHAMSNDELDELLVRQGYGMRELRDMPPGQKIRAAERVQADAGRNPDRPTMAARGSNEDPRVSPDGSFEAVDRPAFSGKPNSERPNLDEADVSRSPNERPRSSYVTGGTGDRPYVDDGSDPNAAFWRERAEAQAADARARQNAEQDVSWAERDPAARGTDEQPPGADPGTRPEPPPEAGPRPQQPGPRGLGAQERPRSEAPPPRRPRTTSELQRDEGLGFVKASEQAERERADYEAATKAASPEPAPEPKPEPPPRPEMPPGPDGKPRSYGRTSGVDDIMADFMRRRSDEAEARAQAERSAAEEPAGLGHQEEPEPPPRQDEPEPEPEPPPSGDPQQEQADPRAKWSKAKTEGKRNRFDELADEADEIADEREAAGNAEGAKWWREHAAHNRANADRQRQWKAKFDQEEREWARRREERERENGQRRQERQRQQDGDWDFGRRWGRGERGGRWQDEGFEQQWQRYERDRRNRASGSRPSDSKSSDPFHNRPTSPTAKQGSNGRYATGTDGVVVSDKGGPLTFDNQKAAAVWIMKEGHAKSPDQIFELANHPTKGGAFTVRERGRAEAKAKANGHASTFYSNPIGPAIQAMWDAAKWAAGKVAGPALRDLGDFAKEIGRAAAKGDGPGALRQAWSAFRRSYDGHMEWLAGHYQSPHLEELLGNFINTAGKSHKAGRTFDEAVQQRVNPRLKAWGDLVAAARASGLSDDALSDMLTGVRPVAAKAAKAISDIRKFFNEEHDYATKAGVDFGKRKDYFPRIFDREHVREKRVQAIAAMEAAYRAEGLDAKKAKEAALNLWEVVAFGDVASPALGGKARSAEPSIFKGREFGAKADKILRDFYTRDLDAVGVRYVPAIARRAEVASRFGEGFSNWDKIVREIRADDPRAIEIEKELAGYVATMTGHAVPSMPEAVRGFTSWLRTFTTLSLMEKATLSSLVEPIVVGMRTGNLADTLGAFRSTGMQLAGRFKSLEAKHLRELAEDLGVIAGEGHNALMAARFNASDELGRRQAKVLAAYFKRTGLEQWTNGTRVAAMRSGMVYMRRLAHDLQDAGARGRAAAFYLKELGVQDAKAFGVAVRGWGDRLPTHAEMFAPGAPLAAYRTAVLRFTDQSILRPTAGSRPKWANHPLGAVVFQLNSYSYAFGRNVVMRQVRLAQAAKSGELPASAYAAQFVAAAVPGFMALALGQYAFGELRDKLYSVGQDHPAADRMTAAAKVERAISRSGLTAGYDQWIQALGGVRYQSSALSPALGPVLGRVGDAVDAVAKNFVDNSPNTNTAERTLATNLYDILIEPGVNLVLGSFGVNPVTAGLTVGVLPNLRASFVDAAAGPKEKAATKPIKGVIELLIEKAAGASDKSESRRPERPKPPGRKTP